MGVTNGWQDYRKHKLSFFQRRKNVFGHKYLVTTRVYRNFCLFDDCEMVKGCFFEDFDEAKNYVNDLRNKIITDHEKANKRLMYYVNNSYIFYFWDEQKHKWKIFERFSPYDGNFLGMRW